MFVKRPGAFPRVEHLNVALHGEAPVLPVNILLGYTGLQVTNTLAYLQILKLSQYKVL
jgi:hypothetical protein